MTSASTSSTLVERLALGAHGQSQAIRASSVLFISVLTAIAAQVSVPLPFTQVPFTFQPMIVLLGGLALGPRLGLASQVLYLAAGAAGLPVFAASATLAPGGMRLLGPTGGYLLSYPFAAFVAGYLAQRGFDRRYVTSVLAMAVGLLVVYAGGAFWLGLVARTPSGSAAIGIREALMLGVVPFVAADLVKLLLAAGVVPGLWSLLGRSSGR